MHNSQTKQKHLEKMRSVENRERTRQRFLNNSYAKGKKWYNNGQKCKMCFTPPDNTWVLGRLNPHWNYGRNA